MQQKQITLQEENAFTFAEEVWGDMWGYSPILVLAISAFFIYAKYWRKK